MHKNWNCQTGSFGPSGGSLDPLGLFRTKDANTGSSASASSKATNLSTGLNLGLIGLTGSISKATSESKAQSDGTGAVIANAGTGAFNGPQG